MVKIFNNVIEYYEAIKIDISMKFLMAQKRFYNDIMSGGVRTKLKIQCDFNLVFPSSTGKRECE